MKLVLLAARCGVVFLIGAIYSAPVYATCYSATCDLGPSIPCEQLVYNNSFNNENCGAWVHTSWVSVVTAPSSYASFSGSSSSAWMYQSVFVPTGYTSRTINVDIENRGSGSSTARLHVEIRSSTNVLLETLEIFSPTDADGFYQFTPANYGGSNVRVRFLYVPGATPGDAEFRLRYVDYYLG